MRDFRGVLLVSGAVVCAACGSTSAGNSEADAARAADAGAAQPGRSDGSLAGADAGSSGSAPAATEGGVPGNDAVIVRERDGGTTASNADADASLGDARSRNDCAPNPHLCGYPEETNTGVPSGVTLRAVPADVASGTGWRWDATNRLLRVEGAGTVVDGLDVTGEIYIVAPNVTVMNTRVTNSGESAMGISVRPGADNATIQAVTVSAPNATNLRVMVGIKAWGIRGLHVTGCHVTHASTGIQSDVGVIENNYVHDMGFIAGDHVNGFTSNAFGGGLTIRHNTIFNQIEQTDALSFFQDFGVQKDALIDDNLVGGGGYTIYAGGEGTFGLSSNIRVTNNRISRLLFPKGGAYGWLAKYDAAGAGCCGPLRRPDTSAPE